ncbi:MAG: thermonuclease family protein [Xanthobacteraceae bacterium]
MSRWLCPPVLLIGTLAFGYIPPALAQTRAAGSVCAPKNAFVGTVSSVRDGRTLELSDGRQIRLATIEIPTLQEERALSAEVAGRSITFSPLSPIPDRYGRMAAQAFVVENGVPSALEAILVTNGLAYVGLPEKSLLSDGCRTALLAAENTARRNKAGLWSDPDYDTKAADNPAAILAARGRFAIVEGKVLSVRDSGGTVYLNFGRRWTEEFTVTILKRITAKFVAAGIDPKKLEGRRVRVCGYVEERGGPWIEAAMPEQIEIADGR